MDKIGMQISLLPHSVYLTFFVKLFYFILFKILNYIKINIFYK